MHKPFDQVARGGRILLVEDNDDSYRRILETLRGELDVSRETDPASALLRLPDADFDLIIVSLSLQDADGLRLCSQVRSLDQARHLPILIIAEPGDDAPAASDAGGPALDVVEGERVLVAEGVGAAPEGVGEPFVVAHRSSWGLAGASEPARVRSAARARLVWDFTVPTETPRTAAVSASLSSS